MLVAPRLHYQGNLIADPAAVQLAVCEGAEVSGFPGVPCNRTVDHGTEEWMETLANVAPMLVSNGRECNSGPGGGRQMTRRTLQNSIARNGM